MAYNKDKIYEQALSIIKEKNCLFMEQLMAYLPIVKQTFYDYYPIGSDEMDIIKGLIENNRVRTKHIMQNKWFKSDAPALQTALYKLIGTDEEADRLNGSRIKTTIDDKRDKTIEITIKETANPTITTTYPEDED